MGNVNLQPIPPTLRELEEYARRLIEEDSPARNLLLEFYHIAFKSFYPEQLRKRVRPKHAFRASRHRRPRHRRLARVHPKHAFRASRHRRLAADLKFLLNFVDLLRYREQPIRGLQTAADGYFSFDTSAPTPENERRKKRVRAAAQALLAGEAD